MKRKLDITETNQSDPFITFVHTHRNILESAKISPIHFKRLYGIAQHFGNFVENEPLREIKIQLLTGELQFYEQHFEAIKANSELIFFAGLSGQLEALDWIYERLLIPELFSNIDDVFTGGVVGAFAFGLILSKDIKVLEWGFNKNLITVAAGCTISANIYWLEGFLWINNKFPEFLFGRHEAPHNLERIFEIHKGDSGNFDDYKTRLEAQWLTGDVHYYEQNIDKIEEHGRTMLLSAARSGQVEAVEWMLNNLPCESSDACDVWAYFRLLDEQVDDDILYYEYGTEYVFLRLLIFSKSIKLLDWALNKKLIENQGEICKRIIQLNWFDGFLWIYNKFPKMFYESIDLEGEHNLEIYCLIIHTLAELKEFQIHQWCKQNAPSLLHVRDSDGLTLVHIAAKFNNIELLSWFADNFPILFDCNDNTNDETIMHIGALYGHQEVIEFGLNYNKELAFVEDKFGHTMAVYALNPNIPEFFNKVLSLTKNPSHFRYDGIQDEYCYRTLKTLNSVLEYNFSLITITTVAGNSLKDVRDQLESPTENSKYLRVMHKLERNQLINALIILLTGFLESTSSLQLFPIEIFNLICKEAMRSYYPNEIAFNFQKARFFKVAECQLTEETSLTSYKSHVDEAIQILGQYFETRDCSRQNQNLVLSL